MTAEQARADYRDRIARKLGLNHWIFKKFITKAEIIRALDDVDEDITREKA